MNELNSMPGVCPEADTPAPTNEPTPTPAEARETTSVRKDEPEAPSLLATVSNQVSHLSPEQFTLTLSQHNRPYVIDRTTCNPHAVPVRSKQIKNLIWARAKESGTALRKWEVEDFIEQLVASAEIAGDVTPVWYRIAPLTCGGFEIDLGDAAHTRVRVTAGKVDIITLGSETVFFRTPVMRPMVLPADKGQLDLLRDRVNLDHLDYLLLLAWMSYTLAHPKQPSSKYVILVVHGDQGSGKTFLCVNMILALLDPNRLGAQVFPRITKDLAIMAEHAHVLVFDNMRNFKAALSDVLCMTSTAGTLSNRAHYSNADLYTHDVHCAVVLNGIHHLVTQADLADRSLTLHTKVLPAPKRASEAEMLRELERDMPAIFRGLLDLTADILASLPDAVVTHPQRMLDFVQWLSAMELAYGYPQSSLQEYYARTLCEAQRDSLLDNTLGNAVVEFAAGLNGEWSGTPTRLLQTLNEQQHFSTFSALEWPRNSIALSRRLNALKASLRTQGILVEIGRGKERRITIRVEGGRND